jgi:hypothetical protein
VRRPRAPTNAGRISQTNQAIQANNDFQRFLSTLGVPPKPDADPDLTRHFVAEKFARWTPVIEAIGMKLD